MEATIHEESPLADYLEGRGDASTDTDSHDAEDSLEHTYTPSFAPRGPPRSLRDKLQAAFPSPLSTQKRRHAPMVEKMFHSIQCIIETGLSRTEDESFVDHFRYLIIASQLLSEQSRPGSFDPLLHTPGANTRPADVSVGATSLEGSIVAVAISFALVWVIHWSTHVRSSSLTSSWVRGCLAILFVAFGLVLVYVYSLRNASRRTHRSTTNAVSSFVDHAHTFDGVTSTSLKLVQEVEIVARGYEITHPLPPVSRLEDSGSSRQCSKLRIALDESLRSVIDKCVEAHYFLQALVDPADLHQYHEIYDIAMAEFADAVATFRRRGKEQAVLLSELRFSHVVLLLARKALLCDLLALPSARSRRDSHQWGVVSDVLQELLEVLQKATQTISTRLMEEESREWGMGSHVTGQKQLPHSRALSTNSVTPRKAQVQAQMRRLDAVSNAVRALNAKMHVLRNEIDSMTSSKEDSSTIAGTLAKQYDNIGTDIRSLMTDWEQGKSTMLLSIDHGDRLSRSSSSMRSPMSPSPSLGGLTAVDEGPAEALRVLNGDDLVRKTSDIGTSDEEIFEAVALPRQRTSMTREEKMLKMQEDRKKRATFNERIDANTSMLRELETVIKHRPRGRTTSRNTTF
jgi:Mysoin-binding motif of peroxisomes